MLWYHYYRYASTENTIFYFIVKKKSTRLLRCVFILHLNNNNNKKTHTLFALISASFFRKHVRECMRTLFNIKVQFTSRNSRNNSNIYLFTFPLTFDICIRTDFCINRKLFYSNRLKWNLCCFGINFVKCSL